MARYAAAYLRRSSATEQNPGNDSRDGQELAVRRLCGDDVALFVDWGKSGAGDKTGKRLEYLRLKAEIEAGKVGTVCVYNLSRLGRNVRELSEFVELCQQHDVTIRSAMETIDTSRGFGRAMLQIMAVFAELELETGKERSATAREARRIRHEAAGLTEPNRPPYGFRLVKGADGLYRREPDPSQPVEPIIAAYREAGSVLGAAAILERQGLPAPRGGSRWSTSLVTRILDQHAPDLLPRRNERGVRVPRSTAILSQLVRCPFCGRTMTPNQARGQLYCAAGARERDRHPRYAVREADVLPFVKAEAARLTIPDDGGEAIDIGARRDAIAARLARARRMHLDGDLDRAAFETEKRRAAEETEALESEEAIRLDPPSIVWDDPEVNDQLRRLFAHIELDPGTMRPVSAEWIVPEWRGSAAV